MKKLVLLMMVSVLFSCAKKEQGDTLVLFMEQEKDVDPYQTRMIVTNEFIRVDDGEGAKSFILYDRNKKVIYSINPDEQSVMAIHDKTTSQDNKIEPPFKLTHSVKEMPKMKDAPTINGEHAKHFQLITNNEVCSDVVSVKGLMPEVVKGLSEFHTLLAADSMVTFNNKPADLYDACEMTATTFLPTRQFEFGFPIQEWGNKEYTRSLVDYQTDYKADAALFVLPEGYKQYTVQDLREGKVSFAD